jgi:NitT/TauT family transport system substrate-binding protein
MRRIVIAVLVLSATLGPGCVRKSAAPARKAVQFAYAYQPFGNNLPFFVAVDKGFFANRGLNITATRIVSANDAATALVRGDVVGDATLPLNVVMSIEEQQPGLVKIFMFKATSTKRWSDYLLVRKASNIRKIEGLRGKRIGAYPGTAQQALLRLILQRFFDPKEAISIELAPNVQLQALASGQVDALLTYDEVAQTALIDGTADVLTENPLGKYVVEPFYGFGYVLSSKFLREDPASARSVRNAMYEAAEFIVAHDAEARQIMAKWTGSRADVVSNVRLWDQVPAEDVDREALQKLADVFVDAGATKARIDASTLLLQESGTRK